jgi:Holliday junction resolvase-like predicted endonuclease
MTHNVGEEITRLYLQIDRGCEFVQYNLYTPNVQGEIDVVAINFRENTVYLCEVAVHLITGLHTSKIVARILLKNSSPNLTKI